MNTNKKRFTTYAATLLTSLFLVAAAWAQGDANVSNNDLSTKAPSFWKIEGRQNTLWLFGSVHVLTEDHYPLADKVEQAFAESEGLVVEVDVVHMNPAAMQQAVAAGSRLPPGTDLKQLLGEERYAKAADLAAAGGYNLADMSGLRPWLITMSLAVAESMKLGYRPDQGVDYYFLTRAGNNTAQAEGKNAGAKTIVELETLQSQLDIFMDMDEETEIASLMQTLEQLPTMEQHIKTLINAWESGRVDRLEKVLLDSFVDYPDVYKRLVTDRNHNWVDQLSQLLDEKQEDYFVVVGALHTVGKEGLVDLLRKEGYKVTKQ